LHAADIFEANLSHSNLTGADLSEVSWRMAKFSNCRILDAASIYASFTNTNFSRADLSGSNLRASDFSGSDL